MMAFGIRNLKPVTSNSLLPIRNSLPSVRDSASLRLTLFLHNDSLYRKSLQVNETFFSPLTIFDTTVIYISAEKLIWKITPSV
jgi:hypothetical protein